MMNISRKRSNSNVNKMNLKHASALSVFSASLLLMTGLSTSAAEIDSSNDSSVYPATFFAQYTPQNALEMVERLPGFSFDQGSDARGFGGNAGNVLIDGARPTSKSGGLRGALTRIPAAQVTQIEIIRGGAGAGEAAGQSIVANVIRSKTGTSGTWALKIRQTSGANPEPELKATVTTTLGEWDTSFDADIGGSPGFRAARIENRDDEGQLTSGASERLAERSRWVYLNGEGSSHVGDGKLTLNARLGTENWRGDPKRNVFDEHMPDGSTPDYLWESNDRNESDVVELGADWTTTGEQWKWRVIGLGQIEDNTFSSDFHVDTLATGDSYTSFFSQGRKQSEYIGRTTFTQVTESPFKPEIGFEVANNELDTQLDIVDNGEVVLLDNATIVVEEQRAEAFATMTYEYSPKLNIEGGLTAEFSQIELSGDDNQKQTFQFYKPRLSATYQMTPEHRFTLEAERRVGQLNFRDFAASTDTGDASTTSGNSNLQPDKTTEIELTYDWSFSERGSLKINLYHEWRYDILEQIRLSDDPDVNSFGLGNAGDARFWGMVTELNLPLDYIIPNGLLELLHIYRRSEFHDPVIDANRNISWYTDNWFRFDLRQDLTEHKLAWGINYQRHFLDRGYRVDEIQTFGGNNRLRFFVESTAFFDVKTRLEIGHVNTAQYTRTRYIYNQSDRSGDFVRSERSARTRKPDFQLSISGTF